MDFFSNGFQKLFAELDNDMQQQTTEAKPHMIDHSHCSNETLYDHQFNVSSSLGFETLYDDSDQINDLVITVTSLTPSESSPSSSASSSSSRLSYAPSTDVAHSRTETNFLYDFDDHFATAVDFDWENQFLDNYIELPDFVNLLPDKTPLCSDSCDLFLKESSENLNKFRQCNSSSSHNSAIANSDITKDNNRPANETSSMCDEAKLHYEDENCVKTSFPCTWDSCEKIYAKPAHLRAHLRRHLGDKPYICNWPNCTWRFSRSDELARHKRSHSGIKPFKCIYCPKCFARSDHLAKHRKVHERKMAASKLRGIYIPNIHQVRPGRKPKNCQYY